VWCQNIPSSSFSFVTIHASDRQTGRRTELRQQYCALHYMHSHGKNWNWNTTGIEEYDKKWNSNWICAITETELKLKNCNENLKPKLKLKKFLLLKSHWYLTLKTRTSPCQFTTSQLAPRNSLIIYTHPALYLVC